MDLFDSTGPIAFGLPIPEIVCYDLFNFFEIRSYFITLIIIHIFPYSWKQAIGENTYSI